MLRTIRNYYEALRDDHDRLQLSSRQEREELQRELRQRVAERDELQEELRQLISERDEQISHERWLGDLLLNRLRLRAPLLALRWVWAAVRQGVSVARLAAESRIVGRSNKRDRS